MTLSITMCYLEWHYWHFYTYAECHYTECQYDRCHGATWIVSRGGFFITPTFVEKSF